MPKPVKNKVSKPKHTASDPILRASQMFNEHMEKAGEATESPSDEPDVNLSTYMSEIGQKGGKVGGKRRLETMTAAARKRAASRAARARWSKTKNPRK